MLSLSHLNATVTVQIANAYFKQKSMCKHVTIVRALIFHLQKLP